MTLYLDIYYELGQWLHGKTLLTMRLVCKTFREMYKIEMIKKRLKEDRIRQSYDVVDNLNCFKCEKEMIYYDKDTPIISLGLIYESEFSTGNTWSISNFKDNDESYYVCIACRRFHMVCPECMKDGIKNLCQFRGHCGCGHEGWCVRYSKDEKVPKMLKEKFGKDINKIYDGFFIDEYYEVCENEENVIKIYKHKSNGSGITYNTTDDWIFYFDINKWDCAMGKCSYHYWRCIQCKREYTVK